MRNWFDDGLQFDLICRNDSKATDYFSSLCDQSSRFWVVSLIMITIMYKMKTDVFRNKKFVQIAMIVIFFLLIAAFFFQKGMVHGAGSRLQDSLFSQRST